MATATTLHTTGAKHETWPGYGVRGRMLENDGAVHKDNHRTRRGTVHLPKPVSKVEGGTKETRRVNVKQRARDQGLSLPNKNLDVKLSQEFRKHTKEFEKQKKNNLNTVNPYSVASMANLLTQLLSSALHTNTILKRKKNERCTSFHTSA